jgi:hypothetical protein
MRDIMLEAYKGRSATAFQIPEGVVRQQRCTTVTQPPSQPQNPQQPGAPPVANRPTVTCTTEIGVR